MKTIYTKFILIVVSLASLRLAAQNYTWMKGAPSSSLAVYGTLGVTNTSNQPGSQSSGITWTDPSGTLWMYGGFGFDNANSGSLNDLWKYSPLTNNWTWVNGSGVVMQAPVYGTLGVPSSLNNPGGRHSSAAWADASGNLWLFGGRVNNNPCNDLWRYSIANNQWTWMGGANTPSQAAVYGSLAVPATTNIPGASFHFVSWKDLSGNFWFYDAFAGTEVWKYNPSTAQWAWMSGVSNSTLLPDYGTMGIPSATTQPGQRYTEGIADASGNLYIFGGKNSYFTGFGRKNDVWKYDISTNQWTWVGGTQGSGFGSFGSQGVFSSTNVPSARYGHVLWMDASNKIWVFGGECLGLAGSYWFNDTWCFNIATGQWAWMKGSSAAFDVNTNPGSGVVYGTQGVSAPPNTPGWHTGASYWPNDPATLWIFSGGEWISSTELWKFNSCTASSPLSIASTNTLLCVGSSAILTANGSVASYSWSTGAQTNTISVSPSATTIYNVLETGSANCSRALSFTVTVPSISISLTNPVTPLCSGQTYVLSAGSASSYSWNTGPNSQTVSVTPAASTVYSLSALSNSCVVTASYALNVVQSPGISISSSTNAICMGQSASLTPSGASTYTWTSGPTGSVLVVTPPATTVYSVNGTANGCSSTATYTQVVKPNPVLTISSSPSIVCSGDPVMLIAAGANSYNWNTGQTTSSFSASPLITTTYTINGTTNGCSSTSTYTQVVKPKPVLTVSSSASVICGGDPVMLTAAGANSYNWNTGQTTSSFSVAPLTTTTYSVNGTINGCSSTAVYTQVVTPKPVLNISSSASIACIGYPVMLTAAGANSYNWSNGQTASSFSVSLLSATVYTVTGTTNGCSTTGSFTQQVAPLPTLQINGPANVICMGEAILLSVLGANTYTWSFQGLNSPFIQVNPALTTNYTVTGTSTDGCESMAAITVTVSDCTGLTAYSSEANSFSIYPNPASTSFTIRADAGRTLEIMNTLGQSVLKQKLESEVVVVRDRLSPGVYYCTISGTGKTVKLVIRD